MGGTTFDDTWKTEIDNLINAFGADGAYLTEFGPSYISLNDYSTDEAVQRHNESSAIPVLNPA